MENKLQELTEKLYNEGLSKGKQEAEELINAAQKEAEQIITKANEQAKDIIIKAEKDAQELKAKTSNDVKMASTQAFSNFKRQIEQAIISKACDAQTTSALNSQEFLQTIILSIIKAFDPQNSEPQSLDLILPEAKQKEMDAFIKNEISSITKNPITVKFNKNFESGFKIGPSQQGYLISFTDNDFKVLISEYLRPKTKMLLFGE